MPRLTLVVLFFNICSKLTTKGGGECSGVTTLVLALFLRQEVVRVALATAIDEVFTLASFPVVEPALEVGEAKALRFGKEAVCNIT